ncbi:hypothetical protein DPMN_104333 [Dreissena polymorpha]|uniref:Uncharacterized protein n=1 Tax=Dreissena polymorpha TaxID=45954 RepID=A0A9D4HA75_DREPO|nr:hypothetical protein DPMN_104333 [Dreissena polymorpha]
MSLCVELDVSQHSYLINLPNSLCGEAGAIGGNHSCLVQRQVCDVRITLSLDCHYVLATSIGFSLQPFHAIVATMLRPYYVSKDRIRFFNGQTRTSPACCCIGWTAGSSRWKGRTIASEKEKAEKKKKTA